jgi:hypothetical protein
MAAAAALPTHANPASRCFLRLDRSATAPTIGRTKAEKTVANVIT